MPIKNPPPLQIGQMLEFFLVNKNGTILGLLHTFFSLLPKGYNHLIVSHLHMYIVPFFYCLIITLLCYCLIVTLPCLLLYCPFLVFFCSVLIFLIVLVRIYFFQFNLKMPTYSTFCYVSVL